MEMTSKEALLQLSSMISREKHINSEHNKKIAECINTIKQDLEVLEILAKYLIVEDVVKDETNIKMGEVISMSPIGFLTKENEDLTKVKEWLKSVK